MCRGVIKVTTRLSRTFACSEGEENIGAGRKVIC